MKPFDFDFRKPKKRLQYAEQYLKYHHQKLKQLEPHNYSYKFHSEMIHFWRGRISAIKEDTKSLV